eukprot:TRINITY_DN1682_c0_g2_i1.p1 TRINITY_DN1682_c0_g2~~TRINITY_DN1682_c0_g2_i1.p1  ORF type:complete len:1496 (-),score=345.43 TRINITY_DN1682_c0_g2_i1:320-4807(-)
MALPPGHYQANLVGIKETAERPHGTRVAYNQDGSGSQGRMNDLLLPSGQLPSDSNFIPQNMRLQLSGNANGGMRLSNISLQTGEEFAWGFSQAATQAHKGLGLGNVSTAMGNFSNSNWPLPHTYDDIRGIPGITGTESGVNSEKSLFGADRNSSGDFEGCYNSGYGESIHGQRISQSTSDRLVAPSGQHTRVSHASHGRSRRSNLSESSNVSCSPKVKLMCSFGGRFLPRPRDGRLRYVGGETHLVTVNRDISYDNFVHKISEIYGHGTILKYQLPGEDLDALVSVSCDEDLENMMEEYEKMSNENATGKLRIFIFDSANHDVGHFNALVDRRGSEKLYVDAVNGIPDLVPRKTDSIDSMSFQQFDKLFGLEFSEEQNANKVETVSSKDSQKSIRMSTAQSCTQMPASSAAPFESNLPLSSSPFFSTPNNVKQFELAGVIHLPVEKIHSAAQSHSPLNSSQNTYFKEQGMSVHDEKHSQTDYGTHTEFPVNHHQDSFAALGLKGDENMANADSSRFVSNDVNMKPPENFGTQQYMFETTSSGLSPDWTFVSQVSQPAHGPLHHEFMDVHQYGFVQPVYISANYGAIPMQHSVEQHLPQIIHSNQPQLVNDEFGDAKPLDRELLSNSDSTTDCQIMNTVVDSNREQPNINQECSSTPSQHNLTEGLHVEIQGRNVPDLNEELCGQTNQNEYQQSGRVFSPSVSHHSSGHSVEQTWPLESYSHGSHFSQPQKILEGQTNYQQRLPHTQPDAVLLTCLKPEEETAEGSLVSPSHQPEISSSVVPSQSSLDTSEKQFLPLQNVQGGGINNSHLISSGSPDQPDITGQLSDNVKHESGASLEESLPLSSQAYKHSGHALSPQEVHDPEAHHGARVCQSEGEDDRKISDLLWGSAADTTANFSRIKSSGDIDVFQHSSLDEPFQALQVSENSAQHKKHASAEEIATKGATKQDPTNVKDKVNDALEVCVKSHHSGDQYSHSFTENQIAFDKSLTDTPLNTCLPSVENESHSHSRMSETWWTETEPSSSVVTHQYQGVPLFGKSLMDEDIVEAYKVSDTSESKNDGFLHSRADSLIANADDGDSYQSGDLPAHLLKEGLVEDKTKIASIDDLDAESKGPLRGMTDSIATSLDINLNATSRTTTNRDWELVSGNTRSDAGILLSKMTEVLEEESVTNQDSDTEEAKIEDSDKDEPHSDAAIAESEAIEHGLQIIKNADLEELRELGCGTFGTVFYGKWRGSDVAIKRIKNSCFIGTPSMQGRMRADFWREACILSKLHHPNVVAFYGVVPDGPGGTLATVTEYMVNGSLKQVLQRKDRSIDRRKRWLITMDAAFGMEYLHSKNIVHFDLKCENLLVNMRDSQRPICKVGDLGLSKIKQHTLVSGGVRGTLPWMAPELLNGSSSMVSEKVDVFSFGIVMWELLTGEEPYANMHYGAIIGGIVSNTLRPPVPSWCEPAWRALMEQCWSADPSSRPSFTEIANRLRATASTFHTRGQNHHAAIHYV